MKLEALPLFPLQAVVFPGLPIGLHVFEERYKRLVTDILAGEQYFGIVAIASGPEVGGEADPYSVGTLMQLVSVDHLDGGRLNIVASSVERIKLLALDRAARPYIRAAVQLWPDDDYPPAAPNEVNATQSAFNEYLAAIMREVGNADEEISRRLPLSLPDDPLLLSILVSSMMQVPLAEKQELLAARSSGERIGTALRFLNRELLLLRSAHAGPALRPLATNGMFSAN